MRGLDRSGIGLLVVLALVLGTIGPASGGVEDLRREIELQQKAAGDLERLDGQHAASGEIALMKSWLDEAWTQQAKGAEDRSREVLDRTTAQAELIRQHIAAAELMAKAQAREAALAAARDKIAKTRQAFQEALIKKKALEMNTK